MSEPQFGELAPQGAGDVCYRHADRVSFLVCGRCSNTVCRECAVPIAVGVSCTGCEKTAERQAGRVRQKRARGAGNFAGRLGSDVPIVTYVLMGACVAVWLLQLVFPAVQRELMYVPLYSLEVAWQPWRMLTAAFTHSTGIWHITFNMLMLWLFGRDLERFLGRVAYALVYFLSAWAGSVAVLLWTFVVPAEMSVPVVGASGALFGVLGATLVFLWRTHSDVRQLLVLLAINLALGFVPGFHISWQAHIGGLLLGAGLAFLLSAGAARRAKTRRALIFAVVFALLATLSCVYLVFPPTQIVLI
ncbi:MAG: rhomboid family intramembrane serine protease [Microbacteriaceae bacterium]|nr:rhomboid family intramembrane serine protease [Microbacteriaceae bacterium]